MNPIILLVQKLNEAELWEKTIHLKRNEYLKVAGSTDLNLYFVEEGSFRIFIWENNEELTIRFGYQNNVIASLDCFISEQPSEMYIQALKKSTVRSISKARYLNFIKSNPEHQQLWETLLIGLVYQQMERERDLLTTSPEERYKRVLERSPQLFQEIPHKYIASYLRMTPETFSRIKKS